MKCVFSRLLNILLMGKFEGWASGILHTSARERERDIYIEIEYLFVKNKIKSFRGVSVASGEVT